MGSADGAETCELVGIYLISKMMDEFSKDTFGIYRDDGLMVVKGGGPEADRARKKLVNIFNNEGLQITNECNVSVVNFLDVVLNLNNGTSRPYVKPNSSTKYVCATSSHPPSVIRSIPAGVSKRLSTISTDKEMFEQEVRHYQEAIKDAGHKDKLEFVEKNSSTGSHDDRNKRKAREVIWFNPPWSSNVRTNIAGKFISLLRNHFPKNSLLYKIFNTKKVKVSYKTTRNMQSIIKSHNMKVISRNHRYQQNQGCNCRDGPDSCPFRGNCLDSEMVYKAEVKTTSGSKLYYGQTGRTFKERHYGHVFDFRHRSKIKSTTLSTYVWNCRDRGEEPEIVWSKHKSAKPYQLGNRRCNLCLSEKIAIAQDKSGRMLNRRREILNRCLHKDIHKLASYSTSFPRQDNDTPDISEDSEDDTYPDNSDAHENLPNNSYTQEVVEESVVQGQNEETDHEAETQGEQVHQGPDQPTGEEDLPHVHQDPDPPDGEEDIPLVRRSKRSRRTDWQCLQYSSVISKEPG